MRASDLLGARVVDAGGAELGTVSDVRLVQDGPLLGTWGAALRVAGLVVSPRRSGSYLGYDRGGVRGPWLVAHVVRWLHRHAVYVGWEDVAACESGTVRLSRSVGDSTPHPTRSKG